MSGKLYAVTRTPERVIATVTTDHGSTPLEPCNSVINHSPDGFEFGYGGSGPAQLALALCVNALGAGLDDMISGPCEGRNNMGGCTPFCKCGRTDRHVRHTCGNLECGNTWESEAMGRAVAVHQQFKWARLALIEDNHFTMTADEVLKEIAEIEARAR